MKLTNCCGQYTASPSYSLKWSYQVDTCKRKIKVAEFSQKVLAFLGTFFQINIDFFPNNRNLTICFQAPCGYFKQVPFQWGTFVQFFGINPLTRLTVFNMHLDMLSHHAKINISGLMWQRSCLYLLTKQTFIFNFT